MITVVSKQNCSGCYACSNICPVQCIKMEPDNEGFRYPLADKERCIDCGLCNNICPVNKANIVNNEPTAYACINLNNDIRSQSSSGGVFTLIAQSVIINGGVVFGAEFDENFNVVHNYTETIDGLSRFRGSKYVQSKIGNTYQQAREFLDTGRQVLFTGTPCQIAGLTAFLQKEYYNLICQDIICYGVPSPKVWGKYVTFREKNAGAAIRKITFRSKDKGWRLNSISISFKNNKKYCIVQSKDLFMRGFFKNTYLRTSCHNCHYKTIHRQSDITLADFWGIQNLLPDFDDDKGTSLVFVNSIKGISIFNRIKDQILYREVDINKAISYNPLAIKSVELNSKREKFFAEIEQLSFDKLVQKYCSDSMIVIMKRKAKSVAYNMLKNTHLLRVAKQILKKNSN